MTTVGIIQARMASTRLPGKILADICGAPMLAHVVRRVRMATRIDAVVVATTTDPSDDVVEAFCRTANVECYRGSANDVVSRYYESARTHRANAILRVTADCPFIDPVVVDLVVSSFDGGAYDLVSNGIRCTYPDGLDAEVFSMDALVRTRQMATLPSDREHVVPFMERHPDLFRIGSVENDEDLSAMRWTVDEPRDLEFVRAVCARLPSTDVGFKDIASVVRADPELQRINAGIGRNAGFAMSLIGDSSTAIPPT